VSAVGGEVGRALSAPKAAEISNNDSSVFIGLEFSSPALLFFLSSGPGIFLARLRAKLGIAGL
jgi:hypothetical protein